MISFFLSFFAFPLPRLVGCNCLGQPNSFPSFRIPDIDFAFSFWAASTCTCKVEYLRYLGTLMYRRARNYVPFQLVWEYLSAIFAIPIHPNMISLNRYNFPPICGGKRLNSRIPELASLSWMFCVSPSSTLEQFLCFLYSVPLCLFSICQIASFIYKSFVGTKTLTAGSTNNIVTYSWTETSNVYIYNWPSCGI